MLNENKIQFLSVFSPWLDCSHDYIVSTAYFNKFICWFDKYNKKKETLECDQAVTATFRFIIELKMNTSFCFKSQNYYTGPCNFLQPALVHGTSVPISPQRHFVSICFGRQNTANWVRTQWQDTLVIWCWNDPPVSKRRSLLRWIWTIWTYRTCMDSYTKVNEGDADNVALKHVQ